MSTAPARALAVIRILIGIGFLWLGVSMLLSHEFLFGGLLERLTSTGGPVRYYRQILPYVERYETFLAHFSGIVSIVTGVFYITGTLISLTSFVAFAMVLNLALASSSGNWPRFLTLIAASLALLLIGRMGAGLTWGVDAWLIHRFKDWIVLFPLRLKAPQ